MSKRKTTSNLTVITGGARSGKSLLAEEIARLSGKPVFYLATMPSQPGDHELSKRIERHRKRRPKNWIVYEVPLQLHKTIQDLPPGPAIVLLDSFCVYLSNICLLDFNEQKDPYSMEGTIQKLVKLLSNAVSMRPDLDFLIVTSEVGSSVVPQSALGRAYRDFLGEANFLLAQQANTVYLVVAGQKLQLKP